MRAKSPALSPLNVEPAPGKTAKPKPVPRGRRGVLGRKGEDLAVEAFREAGLRVLERNWRCRAGEIDLIAEDGCGTTLVVCEVKTRRGEGFGRPAEAVTVRKQARLRLLASAFLSTQSRYWETVRFDVVAVSFGPEGLRVDHRPGAFV